MGNRRIVYIGQSPQDTDLLETNKDAYISIAKLAYAILGTNTLLNGFTCVPTSPAGMTVNVTAGEIYSMQNIDNSAYGSLAADTAHTILKSGINLDSINCSCPAPSASGDSINYLIEIGFSESDEGSQVLPYYNATNPVVPYSGPSNNPIPQYTYRQNSCNIQAKAGTAATTGSQTTPSPDSGFTGAFVVTVAYGATSITSGNISTLSGAPFITETLTQKISETTGNSLYVSGSTIQTNEFTYCADTGSANAYVGTLSPAITSYSAGQIFYLLIANTNTSSTCTVNFNSLGTKRIQLANGNNPFIGDMGSGQIAIIQYNGTAFVLQNPLSTILSSFGTVGYVYTSNGSSSFPTMQAPASLGSLQKISSQSASSSASISFTSLSSSYMGYVVLLKGIVPVTNAANLLLLTSSNNGSSYDNSSAEYAWAWNYTDAVSTYADGDMSDTSISLAIGVSNNSTIGLSGVIEIINPASSSYDFTCHFHLWYANTYTSSRVTTSGGGERFEGSVDAIQFLMSTGNISTGTFELYGILA